MKLLAFFLLLPIVVFSQKQKPKNYLRFDEKKYTFGFMIGGNRSNFTLMEESDLLLNYGVRAISSDWVAGGQVGPVMTMRLTRTPFLRLRLMPSYSFQERQLNYTFVNESLMSIENKERIHSSVFDLPVMLQFRTLRVNNFASYFLLGGQFSIDMQSQENASQNFTDPFIKLNRFDYSGQLGVGVEFFMPFYKFGMEIKYQHGLMNSHIKDNAVIAQPIDRLYNKVWWFSLIFEG
ncbi:MAG: hypothetical protein Crog4KO_31820 [Crocinitomicaceae bacterium]